MLNVPAVDVHALDTMPDHPVVVSGFTPAARCDSLEALFAEVGNPTIRGYREGAVYEYLEKPSAEVAQRFRDGALDFNATDSYIDAAADPHERLTIPPCIDAGNLLNRVAETRYFRKCLVITQRGAYTAVHCDPGGMAGWMYLFRGRKTWHLWEAKYAHLMYDVPREYFYDSCGRSHPDPSYQAIVDALPMWEGTIGPGDLMYFPPGWAHRVWTHEDSFGYGGMSLHAHQLAASVEIFLHDKRLAINDQFDYRAFLEELGRQGLDCSPHLATMSGVFEIWKLNR